jgi:flavorubredoxin
MENLVSDMKAVAVQNKKVSIVENGSWAPAAAKILHEEFDGMKNMSYIGETLTIRSAQYSKEALDTLADAIAESLKG